MPPMTTTTQPHSRAAQRRQCRHRRGAAALTSLLAAAAPTNHATCAFTSPGGRRNQPGRTQAGGRRPATIDASTSAPSAQQTTLLSMSSIQQDDNDGNNNNNNNNNRRKDAKKKPFSWADVLPPAPEDELALYGDVGGLFMYSFLDHVLNDMYVDMLNSQDYDVPSTAGAAGSFDGDTAAAQAHTQLPVWYDAAHSAFGPILSTKVLPVLHAAYAPAIATAGGAAVLLSTAWLVSGYFTGAFLYRNTLGCSTSRALTVAGKTWIVATIVMVGVALVSDQFQGLVDTVRTPALGGLTKIDAEFIFSSLGVLVAWRFILNSMLGYEDR